MRFTLPLILVGLSTLFGACGGPATVVDPPLGPEPLDFEADARILRGVWTGTDDQGQRLLLDLNASEPDAEGYLVTGTFQLGDDEPVVIEGRHFVPLTASAGSVNATVSPVDPFQAESVTPGWSLRGGTATGSPPTFSLWLSNAEADRHFEMTAQRATELTGTEWQLEALRGKPLLSDSSITLEFGEEPHEGFNGYDGCNYYGARYLATDSTFDIVDGIASTAMACDTPPGVMDQATDYTQALADATTFRLTSDQLEFIDAAGRTVLSFTDTEQPPMDPADLLETSWQLLRVNGEELPPSALISLGFPRARVMRAKAGCVSLYAVYNAKGNDMYLEQLGANYDACAEGEALEGYEAAFLDYLSTASDFVVSEAELELYTRQGDMLVFRPAP